LDKVPYDYPNIQIHYYWDKGYIKLGVLKYLSILWYFLSFFFKLKKGDKVLLLGGVDMLPLLLKKRGIEIYVENTEHPKIVVQGNRFFKINPKKEIAYYKKIDGLFVITTALRQYYIDNGVGAEKIHIINIVTDTKRFENVKPRPINEKYIAYCGTISNNKDGVDELIKAFAITSKAHPEVKLFIIGRTPSKEDKSGNLALIHSLGLEEKIVFTGLVSATEMPSYLCGASVLALDRPDNVQAKYGFATKMGEYLLSKRPVVVTKVGDFPLFLNDGESALLANPADAYDFSNKLSWALEHPDEADVIGGCGAVIAMKEFNYLTESLKMIKVIFKY
jgi:glycosyltransferase involved in cell wall biosynthesis